MSPRGKIPPASASASSTALKTSPGILPTLKSPDGSKPPTIDPNWGITWKDGETTYKIRLSTSEGGINKFDCILLQHTDIQCQCVEALIATGHDSQFVLDGYWEFPLVPKLDTTIRISDSVAYHRLATSTEFICTLSKRSGLLPIRESILDELRTSYYSKKWLPQEALKLKYCLYRLHGQNQANYLTKVFEHPKEFSIELLRNMYTLKFYNICYKCYSEFVFSYENDIPEL